MKTKDEFLDSVYEKYEAIGANEKAIENEEEYNAVKKRKKLYKQFGVAAACLVLGVGMISVTGVFRMGASNDSAAFCEEPASSTLTGFSSNSKSAATDSLYVEDNMYGDAEVYSSDYDTGFEVSESESADESFTEPYELPNESVTSETPKSNSKQELKLIYRANMTVQTTDFDKTVDDIKAIVEQYGGYFESQETYNGGYFEDGAYKNAYFTVRIPQEKYKEFVRQVGEGYHVSYLTESVEDIGKQYYDTKSHIETLKIKEERLQELLKKATKMSDIIELESALSENEYQLEQYQSTLDDYDSLVNYSTINLSVEKVTQYSEGVTHDTNFFERLWKSFKNGAINFGERIGDFFIWLGYNIFGIILLIAIVFVLIRFDIFGKLARFVKRIFRKGRKE